MWREAELLWEGLRRISERDAGRLKSTDGGATELTFLLRFELAVLPSPFLSLTLTTAFPQDVEHGRKHQSRVIPLFLLSKLLLPRPQQPTLPSLLLHRPPSTSSLLSDACLSLSSPHFLALPKQSGIINLIDTLPSPTQTAEITSCIKAEAQRGDRPEDRLSRPH